MVAERNRRFLLTTLAAVALGAAVQADENPERDRAESQLRQVLEEIAEVQRGIQDSRRQHSTEQERLRKLDLAIQAVNLRYRALEEEKHVHEAELRKLQTQRSDIRIWNNGTAS